MTDVKDRERSQLGVNAPAPLPPVPITERTLSYRRRLIRWYGLLTLVGGLGLSAIPGPKWSSQTVTTSTEKGVTTQVHRYSYNRPLGFPFQAGRVTLHESGEVSSFSLDGASVLGNLVVSLLAVIGLAMFVGRKRGK